MANNPLSESIDIGVSNDLTTASVAVGTTSTKITSPLTTAVSSEKTNTKAQPARHGTIEKSSSIPAHFRGGAHVCNIAFIQNRMPVDSPHHEADCPSEAEVCHCTKPMLIMN